MPTLPNVPIPRLPTELYVPLDARLQGGCGGSTLPTPPALGHSPRALVDARTRGPQARVFASLMWSRPTSRERAVRAIAMAQDRLASLAMRRSAPSPSRGGPGWGWCSLRALTLCSLLTLAPTAHAQVLHRGNGPEPSTLDAHRCQEIACANILRDLYEGLVADGPGGRPIPGMAERWETSTDGRTWTFHLREGLHWSDGSALDAEQVVASFRRAFGKTPREVRAAALAALQQPAFGNTKRKERQSTITLIRSTLKADSGTFDGAQTR